MNKTLLLILVDFLLLNLLALTRWEKPPEQPPAEARATPAETVRQVVEEDLVGALRLSLDEEREARDALSEQLAQTREELGSREETIAEREARLAALQADLERRQAEAARLAERVADAQSTVTRLSDRLSETAREAATSQTRAEQLARELAEKQAAEARLAGEVTRLERERTAAQQEIQSLSTQVQVAETERTFLRESVDTLRVQVGSEREEKLRLQEQTGRLAEGVTQLAESSANLRQEIRSNTPVNANALFDEFLANRVDVSVRANRPGFLGEINRALDARTILVTDGTNVLVVQHANDTLATARDTPADWRSITGVVRGGGREIPVGRQFFLRSDPRVLVIPLDPGLAASLGVRIYPTALEPFKFPEAVLVSGGGRYYGEVEFKLDPQSPGYVRMQSRVLTRLFGEFSPSAGDLVFSKTGEILGIMVNNTYCVLFQNFQEAAEIPFGPDLTDRTTSEPISAQRARLLRLQ